MRALTELDWAAGWAVGFNTANMLAKYLEANRPKQIVDVGSGMTTVLFAEWAEGNGAKVMSLEHEPWHYRNTKAMLSQYALFPSLRLCKLIDTPHGKFYKAKLPKKIDFALIDGPPGYIGRLAGLYEILPSLTPDGAVWLDDAHRDGEAEILEQWKRDLPITVKHLNYRIAEVRLR